MQYLRFASKEAFHKTVEVLGGGLVPLMIAAAIFIVATLLVHKFRGKDNAIDWLWDGACGLGATVIVGIILFLVLLVVWVPGNLYKTAKIDEDTNTRLSGSLSMQTERANKFSDALATKPPQATFTVNGVDSEARSELEEQTKELNNAKTQLADTREELDAQKALVKHLEESQPAPLFDRLRASLDSIDPKIIPAIKAGTTEIDLSVLPWSTTKQLEDMSKEPGADKLFSFSKTAVSEATMGGDIIGGSFSVKLEITDDMSEKLIFSGK